ncbi:MAG: M16 family metallopeptidase [Bacteroidales bacterium]
MQYQQATLPNGLRIIHMPLNGPVSYCGFAINVGSRDEQASEEGMAHFTEHMIFKGTDKRRSWHILNRMESVGGELNAYTSKEETFVYSVFMEEHFVRACELICDLTLHSRFPQQEIDKETDVILDEINSYKDNPPELIYDEFENMVFSNHALGHNILGEEATLETFTPEMGQHFINRWYRPENMVFFSVGNTDFKKIIATLERNFHPEAFRWEGNNRTAPAANKGCYLKEEKETHQAHVLIGGRAYDMHHESRSALALLNNILGGPGMNSRLNISLREKRGYVYNVESSYTPYSDTGVFSIYFGSDQKKAEKCITLINQELKKLRDTSLTASQLEAAKKQIRGQIGIAADNKESIAMGMAKSFLQYNRYDSTEEVFAKIDRITSSDILKAANEIFDESKLSTLIYV